MTLCSSIKPVSRFTTSGQMLEQEIIAACRDTNNVLFHARETVLRQRLGALDPLQSKEHAIDAFTGCVKEYGGPAAVYDWWDLVDPASGTFDIDEVLEKAAPVLLTHGRFDFSHTDFEYFTANVFLVETFDITCLRRVGETDCQVNTTMFGHMGL